MHLKDQEHPWHMPSAYLTAFLRYAAAKELPLEPPLAGTRLSVEELRQGSNAVSFLEPGRFWPT